MKSLFGIVAVLLFALGSNASNLFERAVYEMLFWDHVVQYNVTIDDGRNFVYRLQVFADNYDNIVTFNAQENTFKMGINKFTHLTSEEYAEAVHLGCARDPFALAPVTINDNIMPIDYPSSFDWVSKGAVSPVKDQGNCGSCWSFSAAGSIEGAYYLKYGNLSSLSTQELVSCDTNDGGCNGGWMASAYQWILSNGGITTNGAYPYTSGTTGLNGACKHSGYSDNPKTSPQSYKNVGQSVSALKSALLQQPIAIGLDASSSAFQNYASGVITSGCGQNINHAGVLVGYGTSNGVKYWKVKNSWGTSWGLNGYVLIGRGSDNQCGVLSAALYPIL